MKTASKQRQGQGADAREAQRKDWEKRVADRTEMAKKAGAHVLVPTSGVTRMILQIAQQMDALYQTLTQQSGLFGSVTADKRMEVEKQLAEHLVGMSLTAEKMAKTVGGRARYFPPRELARYHKPPAQPSRPAKKAEPAKTPAAARPQDAPQTAAAATAQDPQAAPARVAKKAVPAPAPAVELPAVAEPLAATA